MLDNWGDMMEEGNFAGVLSMLEHRLPKISGVPPLDELIQRDSREERREERRRMEEALQQEYASRRVRSVDHLGRAYATGMRKTSVARVWIWPGPGSLSINRRPLDMHFPQLERRADVLAPFEVTGLLGGFNVMATVKGGGVTGQAQALRHGISCALQKWDPELRPPLKAAGFLTRDSRVVERKKPGRAKARKAFQWVKR
ncbi:hypothetical protein COCSUDRAFT_66434 [Coccomyxa subellipsoidea C-169]|uniref:Small ribosomal subunit protein uS9c n=1 Tax=Coccomyxa subellipsoidea (strain C-169) TaxID=574566 RepID=I0YWV5_COCSC|nr:hypothetical protein COCSUDRAFT_66434 [Coccomyxa subellipsoidea C-169]EIE22874.1 hypothetical protein COCSUDRAFT_66434 [Coccomyxa subellipsoidea C-169]|eukprot:XP_005647418.1 hypothetical protein COCSUDRAFT_66434 [Coccomyxa subellipsoidea C-169]